MSAQTAHSLVKPIDLRVTYASGTVTDYRTAPVDVWRLEEFTKQSAAVALESFTGLAYLAYSVAFRKGDAYKPQKATTSKSELFAQWLEGVEDVSVLTEDIPEGEDDAAPFGDGGPVESHDA